MHPNQIAAQEKAAQFLARCRGGFKDHFEWQGWLKKHIREIEELPDNERKAVLMAWNNASTPEASR